MIYIQFFAQKISQQMSDNFLHKKSVNKCQIFFVKYNYFLNLVYKMILIIIIILVILYFAYKHMNSNTEGFYEYYPPSSCVETMFGEMICEPPPYLPFYF